MNLEYLDLVLLHQPFGDYYGSLRALAKLQKEGKIRAIGVSNFYADRLADLVEFSGVKIQVNQIEIHPFNQRDKDLEVMKKYQIQPEAWGTYAEGRFGIFENETLNSIAKNHGKSAAQVVERWNIQRGVVALVKSVKPERMSENLAVFDFELSDKEKAEISKLNRDETVFMDHQTTEAVDLFAGFVKTRGI